MTIETALAFRKDAMEVKLFCNYLYEMLDGGEIGPTLFIGHAGINKRHLKSICDGRVIPDIALLGRMADILSLNGAERHLFYEKASLSLVVS